MSKALEDLDSKNEKEIIVAKTKRKSSKDHKADLISDNSSAHFTDASNATPSTSS